MRKLRIIGLMVLLCLGIFPTGAFAQEPPTATPAAIEPPAPADTVSTQPTVGDDAIANRLGEIMTATGWFDALAVTVDNGVVFLDGQTTSGDYQQWAGELARRTEDVVAVVNRIEVVPPPLWDLALLRAELQSWGRQFIRALPALLFGLVILLIATVVARIVVRLAKPLLRRHMPSPLIVTIITRLIALTIFLLGVYLVLQLLGLTRLAVTVLGGTGIMGIVIGFAFRDIAENFLASILLGMRQPFQTDDMIEVAGFTGIVQQMNTRSTVLMTLDGNHIQIPNATIFKSVITNFTANANRRASFLVGIGYENAIPEAQSLIIKILEEHPAVLEMPEPLVLVEELGPSTVNLRSYFWYDALLYAPHKIRSSLLRLTKRALEEAGISMPDDAREVIFPNGVPIITTPSEAAAPPAKTVVTSVDEPLATDAERALTTVEAEIVEQAAKSRTPEAGENLLQE